MSPTIAHATVSITKEDRRTYVFDLVDGWIVRDTTALFHDVYAIEQVLHFSPLRYRAKLEFKQGVERKIRLKLLEVVAAIVINHAEAM